MAKYKIVNSEELDQNLKVIADAIRSQNGLAEDIQFPLAFTTNITSLVGPLVARTATSISIPTTIDTIGSYTFYNYTNLTSINIPDNITNIGDCAFMLCSGLTSIKMPKNLNTIGSSAFAGCSNCLVYDFSKCTDIPTLSNINAFMNMNENAKIFVPGSLYDEWLGADGWRETDIAEHIVESQSVRLVYTLNADGTAYSVAKGECTDTDIIIPKKYDGLPVTSIGRDAFKNYTSLTSITIPDGVTSIGYAAFYGCSRLESIEIPDSVTSIGEGAFGGCSSITSITIPDGVTSIGNNVLTSCTNLTSVNLPNSVTSIGERAFEGCHSLASVIIPDSVTNIGSFAFRSCYSLTSITIPNSVTSINRRVFEWCYKLVEVINHSSLNITAGNSDYGYVGYYAKEVHQGESKIVNKNDYLFYTHNGINYLLGYTGTDTNLILPTDYNGEKYEIYNYAFRGCTSLASITILDGVTSIGNSAFSGCSLTLVDCSACTDIPTLSSSTSLGTLTNGAKIIVPASLLDEWKAATNWSAYADYIVAATE